MSTRIIGGHDVREEEVPYQILLRMPGTLCGGVLIKVEEKQAVLTAAHCVPSSRRPNDITLVAGNVQLRKESSNEQRRSVTRIIRHSYNSRTMENDIAILALDSPFVENQFVQPIPLPSRNQETSGNVVASGWGLTSQRGRSSDTLKSVIVQVVPQQKCRNAYRRAWKRISDSMLCAAASGKDSCAGDSGGPLRSENGNYLAGIVSWGVVRLHFL